MPYKTASDPNLPPYIKKLSLKMRKMWIAAFNSAYHSFDPNKHKAPNAEAYAFAVANSVVKKARKRRKESVSFFPKETKFVTAREVENYDYIIDEFLEDNTSSEFDNELEEQFGKILEFVPPPSGNAPKEVKQILKKAYSSCRLDWIKENPDDKENPDNKTKCAKVAWSAVKKAGWEQNSDGTWNKKESLSMKDYAIGDSIIVSLKEAKIDKDSRTAEIIALSEGLSKNGRNFYSKEVAESLAPLLLKRRKIFLNHVDESAKKYGRNLEDWVATVEESYGKDGKCYAKIHFTENSKTDWIFKEALIHPEEVQFSIDALAHAREGEVEGKNVAIIEKFVFLNSLDLVDYAAAGGKVVQAYASQTSEMLDVLHEAATSLRDRVEKKSEQDKLATLLYTFINMLYELSWTTEYSDVEDKRQAIEDLIDEFLSELEEIDIVKAFESKLKGDLDMDLKELKEKYSTLLEEYKKEMLTSEEIVAKDTKITTLEANISEVTSSLEKTKNELETLKSDLDKANEVINQYKAAEEKKAKEQLVRNAVKEANLGDFDSLPDPIKKDLLEKDESSMKETISALLALKTSVTGKVVDSGKTIPTDNKTATINLAKDNEAAANVFKKKN